MNVSVTIPTLNERDNLPNCLANLMPQVKEGDEVIVIDGGSDDGTQEIALDAGCEVLVAENSSIGQARNIGAREASNEIVATTDADALPPEGWLERVRSHFEDNKDLSVLWGSIEDINGTPIRNMVGKFSTVLRGASGNNTAYRKSKFMELEQGYPDVSFGEDVVIINRLAKLGDAVRDKELVMVMNMDRSRYQTAPLMGISGAAVLAANALPEGLAYSALGFAAGNMGTEIVHENMTGTDYHHDEAGMAAIAAAKALNGNKSSLAKGAGAGMVFHHLMTEGFSKLPSMLQRNTDKVIGGRDK